MPKKRVQRRRIQKPILKNCFFDEAKTEPSVSKAEELTKFLTDRGKILPRGRSGLCAKHQRTAAREIKRARHLGLLPFLVRG